MGTGMSGERRTTVARSAAWLCAACLAAALAACSGKHEGGDKTQGGKASPPVPVVASRVAQKNMPEQIRAIGNIEAYSTVAVKSRVDGVITAVHFKEGDTVRAGQPIFTIDPRPFEAMADQAQANLARDTALLDNARAQERRYLDLLQRNFVSKEMYAQVRTNTETAQAVVHADEAALKNAKLQLGYCTITSPIDGVTGYLRIQAGNLVKANDTVSLVVINQIEPIYVTFSVPEQQLARIRERMAHRAVIPVEASLGGKMPAEAGKLTFIDNAVDTTTGTIKLKATFDNKRKVLWPGQFAQVALTLQEQENALVVPSQAVQPGPTGSFVYVIRPDATAEQRQVSVERTVGAESVVQGVQAGEQIVTDGQLRLTPGAKVVAKSAL
jgi:multidrug efflux system membrane fusion protein